MGNQQDATEVCMLELLCICTDKLPILFFCSLLTPQKASALSPSRTPPPYCECAALPAWRYETPCKDFLSRSKLRRLSSLACARGQRCRRRTRWESEKKHKPLCVCQLTLITRWHPCSPRCRTSWWIRRLKVLSIISWSSASHHHLSLSTPPPSPLTWMRDKCAYLPPPPAAALDVLTFDHLQSLQLTDNCTGLC